MFYYNGETATTQGVIKTSSSIHRSETTPKNKMQSSEKQGARVRTPNKDSPNHLIYSNDGNNRNIVTTNRDDYKTITRGHPSTRTATSKIHSAYGTKEGSKHRFIVTNNDEECGFVSVIRNNDNTNTQTHELERTTIPEPSNDPQGQWKSKQPHKIENTLGKYRTPQGIIPINRTHTSNTYKPSSWNNGKLLQITRQPKVKKQDLQTEDTAFSNPQTWPTRTYHTPDVAKNKERIGKPCETTSDGIPLQPNKTQTPVNHTDGQGLPMYWQLNGTLVLSPEGLPCCHYCGIPSHNRETCGRRKYDELKGVYNHIHPHRGLPFPPPRYRQSPANEQTTNLHNQTVKTNPKTGVSWICTCNCNPVAITEVHNTDKDDTFTRELIPSSTPNTLGLMNMPLEIMEKIWSYIPFKQRIRLQRVNQRIRDQILGFGTLWKNIFIKNSYLNSSIMKRIIRAKPTSLSIPGCTWKPTQSDMGEIIVELNISEPKLEYLGLQGFMGDTSAIALVITKSKNLRTLDLSEASFALLNNVLQLIDRTNKVVNLNMAVMDRPHLRRAVDRRRYILQRTTATNVMYTQLQQNTIPDLVTKCIWITKLNLCGAGLSQDAIVVICHLITPTLFSINLAGEFVNDEHIEALSHRCPMMRYINLAETAVSRPTLGIIIKKWKHSMEDLSLPDRYVRLFELHGIHGPAQEQDEFKRKIDSIPNLDRLHVGHYRFGELDVASTRKSTKLMTEMFPTLSINLDPFGEAGPSKSNPDNAFNSTIKPRDWARRL